MRRLKTAWAALALATLIPHPAAAESLREVLALVHAASPVLNAQRQQLRSTNESYPQALGGWLPSVEVTGGVGRTRARSVTDVISTTSTTTETESLRLSQDIWRGGRNFATLDKAEHDIEAARAALLQTEQEVLLQATTAYMDVLRDTEILSIRTNNVRVLERHLEATQVQYDLRRRTEADLAQSRSRLLQAEAATADAAAKLHASRQTYERMTGQPPGTLSFPPEPPAPPPLADGDLRPMVEATPAVRQSAAAIRGAESDLDIADGALLPSVTFDSSYTRGRSDVHNQDPETKEGTTAFALNVTIPLYQKGQAHSRSRQAKYTLAQRRLELDEAYRRAVESLRSNTESWRAAGIRIAALEQQVDAASVALESITAELQVGRRTVLDLLDQEQEFLNARLNLITARRDRAVAAYTIQRDIGQMTAQALALDTIPYDPDTDFAQQKYKLFGLGTLPALPSAPQEPNQR